MDAIVRVEVIPMKKLTTEQARCRSRWMTALFVLVIVLTALSPIYVAMTLGGGLQWLISEPELAILWVIFWPGVLLADVRCLLTAAALPAKQTKLSIDIRYQSPHIGVAGGDADQCVGICCHTTLQCLRDFMSVSV